MIIEIDNVELYFNTKCILNGIYLKAETGKITGILGRNGSGKSCLLHILFGALDSKYKLVRIDGKPILKPLYQTKLIALLPQYHLFPKHLKLKTAFNLFNVSWDQFISVFKTFVNYNKNIVFNNLSGGERRLLETYIILKSNRKIILLDEPFSHVSPLYVDKIKKLISEEKKHKAILVTDHMYRDILDISDNLYLIKNGHTKQIENLKELEENNYVTNLSL